MKRNDTKGDEMKTMMNMAKCVWKSRLGRLLVPAIMALAITGAVLMTIPTAHASIIPPGGGSGCQQRDSGYFHTRICADGPHYYSNGSTYYNVYPACWEDHYYVDWTKVVYDIHYEIGCTVTRNWGPVISSLGGYGYDHLDAWGKSQGGNPAAAVYFPSTTATPGQSIQIQFWTTSSINSSLDGMDIKTLVPCPSDSDWISVGF